MHTPFHIFLIQLVLPPSLTPRQRAVIHEAAGAAGLGHSSIGEGDTRQLTVGTAAGAQVCFPSLHPCTGSQHVFVSKLKTRMCGLCALLSERCGQRALSGLFGQHTLE